MLANQSVYLLGIGGIAMANVAILLRQAGFEVSGSDQSIYEPAASLLRRADIAAATPYSTANLPTDGRTTVIVGNVHSRGHIEVEEALNRNLPLESFPAFLRRTVMAGKRRIVIAGTHGKSTTTACMTHLLHDAGRDPSYLIGADPLDLPFGGGCGSGREFVIEGDEYDSAFFDKRSKFLDYFPHILLLGRVEHDHLDIFPTLEDMLLSYRRLVAQLPAAGTLVVAADSPHALALAAASPCPVIKVSADENSDYILRGRDLQLPRGDLVKDFSPGVLGDHNRLNVAMSIAGAIALGVETSLVLAAAQSYRGIKRRLELLYRSDTLLVYDDFAHHPTAIAAALHAVRETYPGHHLIAVFEPRSNTAVRNKYQDDFRAALAHADEVILGSVHRREKIPLAEVVDTLRMCAELTSCGVPAVDCSNEELASCLLARNIALPTVVLFMSNGAFGGASTRFVAGLQSQHSITA
ncbi:MAG: hypothetical protein IPH10_03380 [bacterium]|nr:hypothetical protein [bacterium]